MSTPLTLMAVHAHPDDESSSTGGVLARYSDEGCKPWSSRARTASSATHRAGSSRERRVTTRPRSPASASASSSGRARRSASRTSRCSGTTTRAWSTGSTRTGPTSSATSPSTTPPNASSDLFEQYRPDVVVTYDELGGYDHPDHVHASRVTMAAVARTGIPRKAYFTAFRRSMFEQFRAVLEEQGADVSQFPQPDPEQLRMMDAVEARITTAIDISRVRGTKAHRARDARQPDRGVVLGPPAHARRSARSLVRRPSSERTTPPARHSRRPTSSSGCARNPRATYRGVAT